MSGRDWRGLGGAALIGALVAFPCGMLFASRDLPRQGAGAAARSNTSDVKPFARNVYSPVVLKDPYVHDQQRIVVEGLEAQCRHSGERCEEAKAARRWWNEQN
jgi:hypothetical protein